MEAALAWEPGLNADGIRVRVERAGVTLRGTVARQFQKDAASRLAEELMGVRNVENAITVVPDRRPDAGELVPAIMARCGGAASSIRGGSRSPWPAAG